VGTGAKLVVDALHDAGVTVAFGLPGVHNMALWDAIGRDESIRLVGVRHEQTAVYAADGYARATGEPGVALVTTGPGAANTLGATGEAWASRSPVVVIATDVPTGLRRDGVTRGSLHEGADQAAMFAPVTVARFGLDAVHQALVTRGGPVYVGVPADLLAAPAPAAPPAVTRLPARAPDQMELPAQRPLVWAGGGARDAEDEVVALAERLGAPILTTYTARGLGAGHPLAVGLPPHSPEAGALWDDADLVVSVGSDLDGMNTQNWRMPRPPVLIAVNTDAADATKNYPAEHVVEADAAAGCAALARGESRAPWADLDAVRAAAWARLRSGFPAETAFLDAFAAAVPDEAIVLADMCIPGYWLGGFRHAGGPRHLQYPMGWGTLGFAFPASIGAACAARNGRPVVSVSGDGGFLFACGELATVAQEQLPLTTVIVDDSRYGMLGVDLPGPDFVALARSFGVEAEGVDGLGEEFSAALARHVAAEAPSVLVAQAALEPPETTSPRWYRAAAGS
jgi:acetolactate synthase-1/2/3 large subunit